MKMELKLEYEVVESTRAKGLRVTVHTDGRVVVTKPHRMDIRHVQAFIEARRGWIEAARGKFLRATLRKEKKGIQDIELPKLRRGSKEYRAAIQRARELAASRLLHFNTLYTFSYGTLSIRNQTTRWGSCSSTNNLSFNFRIAHLPPELADYLVVHELCHTKEHNHSERFWAQVERAVPNHKELRVQLRRYKF